MPLCQFGYYDGFNVGAGNDMFRMIDRLRDLYGAMKRFWKKGKITVLVNGTRCKVLGQVGMHHAVIDVTDVEVQIGTKVIMDVKPIYIQSTVRREYR